MSETSSALAAHKRPVPTDLPIAEREQWRKLPFDGPHNFRELGGYKNEQGQSLKYGMLYRADKLSHLSDDDLAYVKILEIKTVVDFRSDEERLHEPNNISELSQIKTELLTVDVRGAAVNLIREKIANSSATSEDMGELLVNVNREFVEHFTPTFKKLFELLLNPESYPLVFHCTAGKDRTGFAAALILKILGVNQATVMQDYLATNTFTHDAMDQILERIDERSFGQFNTDALRALFAVQEHYLQNAFNTINKLYGNFDDYVKEGLGLEQTHIEQLKELLLD